MDTVELSLTDQLGISGPEDANFNAESWLEQQAKA